MMLGLSSLFASAYANENQLLAANIGGVLSNQFDRETGRLTAAGTSVMVAGLIDGEIGPAIGQSNSVNYYGNQSRYPAPEKADYPKPYIPNYVAPSAPPPTYIDNVSGDYCRDYSELIKVGGHVQESYGTACLQPDGSWRVVQ